MSLQVTTPAQREFEFAPQPPAKYAWKIARRTSRAAFYEAELSGRLRERERIVGRALRGLWNRHQRSATSSRIAKWIQLAGKDWRGREWTWILIETRRALSGLREKGLADTSDRGGREMFWRWREAGVGERKAS